MIVTIDKRGVEQKQGQDRLQINLPCFFGSTVDFSSAAITSASSIKTATVQSSMTTYITLANASAGSFSVILPDASLHNGETYHVKKIDATGNSVTISTSLNQTIDGSSSIVNSTQWLTVTMVASGSAWYIL